MNPLRNRRLRPWRPACTLALLLGLLWGMAPAASAAIPQVLVLRNLLVANSGGDILVRFSVSLDSSVPVGAMLQDGEVLGLRCQAVLERLRTLWFNKTLLETRRTIYFRYDQLNNRFVAEEEGRGRIAEHPEIEGLLSRSLGEMTLNMGPWTALTPDADYRVELDLRLDRVNVPAWLKRSLFFWDFEVTPQARYQLEFGY